MIVDCCRLAFHKKLSTGHQRTLHDATDSIAVDDTQGRGSSVGVNSG